MSVHIRLLTCVWLLPVAGSTEVLRLPVLILVHTSKPRVLAGSQFDCPLLMDHLHHLLQLQGQAPRPDVLQEANMLGNASVCVCVYKVQGSCVYYTWRSVQV